MHIYMRHKDTHRFIERYENIEVPLKISRQKYFHISRGIFNGYFNSKSSISNEDYIVNQIE